MARYRIDGAVVDTDNATAAYSCRGSHRWNGNNHICGQSGSQWEHQTLYRSRKGRYYVEYNSQWQGSLPRAEWVSKEEAARWLLVIGAELPAELVALAGTISE